MLFSLLTSIVKYCCNINFTNSCKQCFTTTFEHLFPKLIKPRCLFLHYGSNYAFIMIHLVKKKSITNYVHSDPLSSQNLLLLSTFSLTGYLVLRRDNAIDSMLSNQAFQFCIKTICIFKDIEIVLKLVGCHKTSPKNNHKL